MKKIFILIFLGKLWFSAAIAMEHTTFSEQELLRMWKIAGLNDAEFFSLDSRGILSRIRRVMNELDNEAYRLRQEIAFELELIKHHDKEENFR